MTTYAQTRVQLERMEAALQETRRVLSIIERQIASAAEKTACSLSGKQRQYGRGTSTWTSADERLLLVQVERLRAMRHNELGRLTSKIRRQSLAIEALRRRHGINEPPVT